MLMLVSSQTRVHEVLVIIGDDQGFFLAASCCSISFISDASTADARALQDGLILVSQMGCNRLEVNLIVWT
jgi:hypothetical protein